MIREYERAVVFQLGRFWKVKGPGLILVIPVIQQAVKVDLRIRVHDIPSQDIISRDNVLVKVNAVVYYRVIDARNAIIQVEDFNQRDQPARPDHAALGARPARARRDAGRARAS